MGSSSLLLWFRTWRRRRTVAKYERDNGGSYNFHGVTVILPSNFSVDLKNALIKGKYETEERNFIDAHIPKNCDVIELGGSVGVVASFTRARMAPETRQIVVEAIPELAEICRRNIARQDNAGRSTVVEAAVSYSGADTVRFTAGDNPHVGRIAGSDVSGGHVPVVTLEQLCATHNIGSFALICDIEGAEVELFEKSEIWRSACQVIVLETHPQYYENGVDTQQVLINKIVLAGFCQLAETGNVFAFGKHATRNSSNES